MIHRRSTHRHSSVPMLGLAIHTSSPQLGLMLKSIEACDIHKNNEPVERYQVWDLGREVSSQLHAKMIEFIAPYSWQDLSFVAVAKGPGGFTGTRVGVVAARTLAQQLDIPLYGVSSLAAIAAQHTNNIGTDKAIAVTLPAKREAVYGAIYHHDDQNILTEAIAESVVPEDEWAQQIEQWKGAPAGTAEVKLPNNAGLADSVCGVMMLAMAQWNQDHRPNWSSVMPFYGQHPVHR